MDEQGVKSLKSSLNEIAHLLSKHSDYKLHCSNFLDLKHQLESILNSNLMQTGNHITGNLCLNWLQDYISKLLLASSKTSSKFNKFIGSEIEILTLKVLYLKSQLHAALSLSHKDLASLPEDHPRVIALKNHTTSIDVISAEEMQSEIDRYFMPYNAFKGMILRTYKYKQSKWRQFFSGYYLIYYLLFKKESKRLEKLFDAYFTKEYCVAIWRLVHSSHLRALINLGFPQIYLNKVIYVPKLFNHVLSENPSSQISSNSMYSEINEKNRLEIRINHHCPIKGLMPMNPEAENENIETIIIYIHGGGLLAGTTFEVQHFTRGFANTSNLPVFSLEYRLVPEFPYPAALDDVWQSYNWILTNAYDLFRLKPNKIILVGDSAGCNLVVALTNRLIESDGRVPDSIILAYPFLSSDLSYFSKSAIYGLESHLLPFNFEAVVDECYPGDLDSKHYMISPVHTPSKNLKRFPKTRFISPMFDPLYYNGIRFAEKLVRKGRDVHVYEFPNAIHGAMNFGNKAGIPKLSRVFDTGVQVLKELIA